jgi:cytochrome bd-type quinol oxidase subunit 2
MMNFAPRRIAYVFLCALPFLDLALAGARPLRVSPVYQIVGIALFVFVVLAAWAVGARTIRSGEDSTRKLALSGLLLLMPYVLIALLWIGIGAPFQASASENYMRYLVLITSTVCVTGGFIILHDSLPERGERLYSSAGFAAAIPAGAAYLVCLGMSLAGTGMRLNGDTTPPPSIFGHMYDALEFVACTTTYLATALFAVALARANLLGRGGARGYAIANVVLIALIVTRGVGFPEISENSAPWYTRPGVIAGIPAIPWLMPALLGGVLLKRAGETR